LTAKEARVSSADELLTIGEIEQRASRVLTKEIYDYVAGGGGQEATVRGNREAIERILFRPRIMRDVSKRSTATTFLGVPLSMPIMLAPVGSIALLDPEGAAACARAAHAIGTSMFVATYSRPSLEEVRRRSDGPLFFQLLVRGDRKWMAEIVRRVEDAGYAGLCVTVDIDVEARRERMIVNRFSRRAAHGPSPNVLLPDPDSHVYSERWDWKELEWLRAQTELPLILKGVTAPEDAELAIEHGVQVIYVSNHGGRSLDYQAASIESLEAVAAAVAGRAEVLVDGGFMHGEDVLKAVALGARAVLIGRLQCWALAAAGEEGLKRALELLRQELSIAMGLLGLVDIASVDRRCLVPPRRDSWW
jgi:isopentenyl diphosphate isomerase/L-lactate dehydrogenase-like FMN-dependent dehydrogenase